MKKIIIILFLLLLTGCRDYVEINELAIITGMAIDYKDDQIIVTAQIVETNEESVVKVYTAQATTIEKAITEISRISDKELFFPHLKVLIVTENIIENGINYYDLFLRNSKAKMNFYVYLVDSSIVQDVLNIYKDIDGSALYIERMIKFNEKIFSSSTPLDFIDTVKNSIEYGIDSIYPKISIVENNKEKVIYLDNLVAYNKNQERLELTEMESIFYNILVNKAKRTIVNINCDENIFSLDFRKMDTKFSFKDGIFTVEVSVVSKINSYHCTYDISKYEAMKKLEDITEKYVTKEINNLINKAKNNNNDFIGFGNYIYKHNNKYFDFENQNWDVKFKDLKIKIKSDVSIISSGEIRRPIGAKYAEDK